MGLFGVQEMSSPITSTNLTARTIPSELPRRAKTQDSQKLHDGLYRNKFGSKRSVLIFGVEYVQEKILDLISRGVSFNTRP